jgi:16S rRNA (cytosine967-C5)-methyltransferase
MNNTEPTPHIDPRGEENKETSGVRGANARSIAVKIVTRVEGKGAWLDKLLTNELGRNNLSERDRRLVTELATGVIRWRARLDWVLVEFYKGDFSEAAPIVRNALRVALYQILFLDRIPDSAAVNEAVELVKHVLGDRPAGMVNGILRSVLRRRESIKWPDREQGVVAYFSVMGSHPEWMIERWIDSLGEAETERLLDANNQRPHIALRVNPMRTSTSAVLELFAERDLAAQVSPLNPRMVVLDGLTGIGDDPGFREGLYTVQDVGGSLAALLADARPGMRVIDLCAAPGGKSTAMAEAMEARGDVIAVDLYEAKLPMIAEAAKRLGLSDVIHPTLGDARTIRLDTADLVLVDAPCSGLGVLSRKPDIKWKRTPEDITAMTVLQGEILDNAATLVRPGGHLVYTTCTTEPDENQRAVEAFLLRHPTFSLIPAETLLPDEVVTDGYLQSWPHRDGIDGAFGARLINNY